MRPWFAAGLCTAAATLLLLPEPRLAGQTAAIKQRSQASSTPGVLGRIGEKRFVRPAIETDGAGAPAGLWDIDPATGAQYRRGELLVQFRDGVDASTRAQAARAARGERMPVTLVRNWEVLQLDGATSLASAAAALRAHPDVAQVSLNYRVTHQQLRPNDEHFGQQWNFQAINLPTAWQINPGANGDLIVAVIDTGLNTSTDTIAFSTSNFGQVALRFAVGPDVPTGTRIVSPFDFVYRDDLPVDLDGHGTHVTGTFAQETNNSIGAAGVAYKVRVMPLKVLGTEWDDVLFPFNPGGSTAVVAEAVRYAADNGAKIINMSLGGRGQAPAVRDALQYAVSRGAFVAISAGNEGDDGNPLHYPAGYANEIEGVMAVGAVSRALRRAEYSNFHPYVEVCAPGGEVTRALDYEQGITQITYDDDASLTFLPIDLMAAALRQGIRPTFDQFMPVPYQGTSMASPHVAGVAALLYTQGIRDPRAIEQAIKRFAAPINATADECGAGLIDARRALRGLGIAR